jgi:hypothetical protein
VRRFVDPHSEFVFVDDADKVDAGATPFDMRGVELPGVLVVTGAMFDGLYEHRRRALLLGRDPA